MKRKLHEKIQKAGKNVLYEIERHNHLEYLLFSVTNIHDEFSLSCKTENGMGFDLDLHTNDECSWWQFEIELGYDANGKLIPCHSNCAYQAETRKSAIEQALWLLEDSGADIDLLPTVKIPGYKLTLLAYDKNVKTRHGWFIETERDFETKDEAIEAGEIFLKNGIEAYKSFIEKNVLSLMINDNKENTNTLLF